MWASELDEDTLYALLWAVGEFGIRAQGRPFPIHLFKTNQKHAMNTQRMSVALQALARIQAGEPMTFGDIQPQLLRAKKGLLPDSAEHLRDLLVEAALLWEDEFGVAPRITSSVSEFDAARLLGLSAEEYSRQMQGRTAVATGHDFEVGIDRIQVKANRPSGKPGSRVTLVGKPRNLDWDHLVWILYDPLYRIVEAWKWDRQSFEAKLYGLKRLSPEHMRKGERLA